MIAPITFAMNVLDVVRVVLKITQGTSNDKGDGLVDARQ